MIVPRSNSSNEGLDITGNEALCKLSKLDFRDFLVWAVNTQSFLDLGHYSTLLKQVAHRQSHDQPWIGQRLEMMSHFKDLLATYIVQSASAKDIYNRARLLTNMVSIKWNDICWWQCFTRRPRERLSRVKFTIQWPEARHYVPFQQLPYYLSSY